MPDTAPARLPGVPRWRRGIYGMRAHSTNGQRRAVCSQLSERCAGVRQRMVLSALRSADILPCAVRL